MRVEKAKRSEDDWKPKVVAFVCKWCPSLSVDLAGAGKNQYPANVRVIQVPCVGRINPLYVAKALQIGADGVVVFGCHPGDCHHLSGNLLARRRFSVLQRLLQHFGFEPERIQISWISGSEGVRFAGLIEKMVRDVTRLGPMDKLVKRRV
jgi:coenzyme F420-reducing hydrogenase delta subunit